MSVRAALIAFAFGFAALGLVRRAGADGPRHLRRIAVLVGANQAPPGRQSLRVGYDDANQMADVLRRVGEFADGDVRVLLDPHPDDVLAAIADADQRAREARGEALVLFYYSGHSDGQSIFPRGETLAVADVRDRLSQASARIRVGILDTCRGGGWTQTKGLTIGPALDPADLLNVATEGTALVASSSGLENAHEGDLMRGSFFTHYFAAGLLGAADRRGDGEVTLQEAFEYAKERTVRDTARMAVAPQHPSFDIRLRGRQDIVLASLSTSGSALQIAPPRAVLEVIHLDSGLVIAEAPPGDRPLRLAVAPGRYLVRRVEADRIWSKEIEVHPGETARVSEGELELSGAPQIAMKGNEFASRPIALSSSPPKGWWSLGKWRGTSTAPASSDLSLVASSEAPLQRSLAIAGSLTYGITDRLTWLALTGLAYRFGHEGDYEIIPRGGLTTIGYAPGVGILSSIAAGVAVRMWATPSLSLIATADANWNFRIATSSSDQLRYLDENRITVTTGVGAIAWERPRRSSRSILRPDSRRRPCEATPVQHRTVRCRSARFRISSRSALPLVRDPACPDGSP